MTPTIVHRYAFPVREVIETLLGDAVGDCEAWRIRIEGDEVIVDVIAPAPGIAPTMDEVTGLASNETAKSYVPDPGTMEPAAEVMEPASMVEPELKGGPLARRAAILCTERGFWTFSDTSSEDEAADWLRDVCGITSRKMLDHDERAAREFHQIDGRYKRWLQGYDD